MHIIVGVRVNIGVHQGSVLSPLMFAIVVDGSINEILYADDLVLVGETMKDLREKFCDGKKRLKERE